MNVHKQARRFSFVFLLIMAVTTQVTIATCPLEHPLLKLASGAQWKPVDAVPLRFNAFHTQGLVKIGEFFYLSAVEVTQWPRRYDTPQGALDRDAGVGRGHIFKFDRDGNLLHDLPIGRGDAYHPGGMDYDGKFIWIPVTEYRPHSFSIIYRLDPETMTAEEVMTYDDSIGAMIHDTDDHALIGVNWDARQFYRWTFNAKGVIDNADVPPERLGVTRGSSYVAFQDGQYLGNRLMLCSGLQSYSNGTNTVRLGGWEVIDLRDFRPVLQLPVREYAPVSGTIITNNPCAAEITPQGIRAYFVPNDDNNAVLLIYDVQ
ncbi:MAG: DUF6454 family protein [Tannerella sp.]|jgi:hypothetical protein|nr:DUF6454 family protein [Tannerella sp.]